MKCVETSALVREIRNFPHLTDEIHFWVPCQSEAGVLLAHLRKPGKGV